MSGRDGARIVDLTKELKWQPHTVRAAVTRLRQSGHAIIRSKTEAGDTIYRAASSNDARKAPDRASRQ
jgi:DNA-binding transcriptional regulator PaaX